MILIAATAILAVSCAKDRTCNCTTTSDAAGSTPTMQTITLVKVTKGQAKANCLTTTQTFTAQSGNVVVTRTCKLS